MSGGSFNYLYCKEVEDIGNYCSELRSMAYALAEYPGGEFAAVATEAVRIDIETHRERLGARLSRLGDVWHAVEWHHSRDYAREQAVEAIAKFNALPAAVEIDPARRIARAALSTLPGGAERWPDLERLVAAAIVAARREWDEGGEP